METNTSSPSTGTQRTLATYTNYGDAEHAVDRAPADEAGRLLTTPPAARS
jgi:hypothetical protein